MLFRKLLLTLLLSGAASGILPFSFTVPEAKAFDPVTIAILTPVAIKAAQIAMPYVLKGLKNMGKAGLKIFPDMLQLCKLPIGLFAVLFGWPFGYFSKGLKFLGQGALAPFKLAFHAIMIPVGLFGIGVS